MGNTDRDNSSLNILSALERMKPVMFWKIDVLSYSSTGKKQLRWQETYMGSEIIRTDVISWAISAGSLFVLDLEGL